MSDDLVTATVAALILGVSRQRVHQLVDAGTSAKVVSDLMGHSTVAFTLQSYVHPDKTQAEAAVDTVERLLGG